MNLLGCETAVLDTSDDNLAIVYIKGYNSETKTYEKQIRFDLTEKIYKEYEGNDSVWVQFNLSGNPTAVSHNASPILDIEDEVYVKAVKNFKENLNILETQILGNNKKTILYGQTVTQLKEKAY
ncbi:MAG: hypothetical protein MJ246_06410 [Clostridia bacterium]|nr:hypothetical protein [Clostridia bacterium]